MTWNDLRWRKTTTNRQTDKAGHRVACTQLKKMYSRCGAVSLFRPEMLDVLVVFRHLRFRIQSLAHIAPNWRLRFINVISPPSVKFVVQSVILVEPLQEVCEVLRWWEVGDVDVRVRRRNGGVVGAASYHRNRRGCGQRPVKLLRDVIAAETVFKGQVEFVSMKTILRLLTAEITAVSVNIDVDWWEVKGVWDMWFLFMGTFMLGHVHRSIRLSCKAQKLQACI